MLGCSIDMSVGVDTVMVNMGLCQSHPVGQPAQGIGQRPVGDIMLKGSLVQDYQV